MLSTFLVLAYACIALLSMRMTVKEFQANPSNDRIGLCSGILACLVWPLAAIVLLLMVNLNAPVAARSKQTI